MEKVIIHIDFDSFFASVEQQYNPHLRNKPVGVTATNGRTCIIAASKEAKRFGIGTASRSFDAQQRCPEIQFVPADFVKYAEVSRKFLRLCSDYSPSVEMFSIDEVFIDLTKTAHLFGGIDEVIRKIKKKIRDDIGEYITASVGISYNKLLAKLASGLQKPNGIVRITKENIDQVYRTTDLMSVCGIGPRILKRLHQIGIYTFFQLRMTPLHYLIAEFGVIEGRFLKNVGLGIDESPVIPYSQAPSAKSIGRNYCLPENEYSQRAILQHMYELSEEVGIKLRRLGKKAKIVSLSLRGKRSQHGNMTSSKYIATGAEIFEGCKYLYDTWRWGQTYDEGMVRQICVYVANLHDKHGVPEYLFENPTRRDRLVEVIDAINDRFGHHTIRNGFLLQAPQLTTVPNGYGSDRYERVKLAEAYEEIE